MMKYRRKKLLKKNKLKKKFNQNLAIKSQLKKLKSNHHQVIVKVRVKSRLKKKLKKKRNL